MLDTTDNYLYHYTTAEGLIGIVNTHTIWATNILYLNDTKEFRHGARLGASCVKEWLGKAIDPDEKAYLEKLLATAEEMQTIEDAPGYVCSFSELGDDLSQWRAYCPRGGFAIGFRKDLVKQIAYEHLYEFAKCSYDPRSQQRAISAFVKHGIAVDKDCGNWPTKCPWGAMRLTTASAPLKDPAFASEQEWRMVRYLGPNSEKKDVDFRPRNGLVVPYMKCELEFRDKDGKVDMVRTKEMWESVRVTIGPTPNPEVAKGSVEKLLQLRSPAETHGEVRGTSVPYKFW